MDTCLECPTDIFFLGISSPLLLLLLLPLPRLSLSLSLRLSNRKIIRASMATMPLPSTINSSIAFSNTNPSSIARLTDFRLNRSNLYFMNRIGGRPRTRRASFYRPLAVKSVISDREVKDPSLSDNGIIFSIQFPSISVLFAWILGFISKIWTKIWSCW